MRRAFLDASVNLRCGSFLDAQAVGHILPPLHAGKTRSAGTRYSRALVRGEACLSVRTHQFSPPGCFESPYPAKESGLSNAFSKQREKFSPKQCSEKCPSALHEHQNAWPRREPRGGAPVAPKAGAASWGWSSLSGFDLIPNSLYFALRGTLPRNTSAHLAIGISRCIPFGSLRVKTGRRGFAEYRESSVTFFCVWRLVMGSSRIPWPAPFGLGSRESSVSLQPVLFSLGMVSLIGNEAAKWMVIKFQPHGGHHSWF